MKSKTKKASKKVLKKTTSAAVGYHHGDLKNELLEAALRHIERHREVTFALRELAKEIGVSSAAPFRHFATKRALLAAIAEQGYEILIEKFEAIDRLSLSENNPVECFQKKGIAYVEFAISNQARFLVMSHPELSDKNEFPKLKKLLEQAFGSLHRSVEVCQRAGLIEHFSTDNVALVAWSGVHGLAVLLMTGQLKDLLGLSPSGKIATETAKMLTSLFGRGLVTEGHLT